MTKRMKADLALLAVTVFWGASFLLTKYAIDELAVFNFLGIRFLTAFGLSSLVFWKRMKSAGVAELKSGIILGAALFAAFGTQTIGLQYTSVSKSAFITGLNVVLVPVFVALLSGRMPKMRIILSVLMAVTGLGFLTLSGSTDGAVLGGITIGDWWTIACAVLFAAHIVMVGKCVEKVEAVSTAVISLGVVGLLSILISAGVETPVLPTSPTVWGSIFILSVFCTSGAYILQNVAQQHTTPTHTALIYAMEPVFAAVFGFMVAGEVLSGKGMLGAVMIVGGMLVAELDVRFLRRRPVEEAA